MIENVEAFFSGALLFNSIPHLVQGICGRNHMTPFSRSSGPVINVVWAWINMALGIWLFNSSTVLCCHSPALAAFAAGAFLISLSLAKFWSNPDARLPWHKE
jgi:hypothetical protein